MIKRCKSTIAVLLALLTALCTLTTAEIPAQAEETPAFSYSVLDDGTIELTSCETTAETVIIPSTIDGYSISSLGRFLFEQNKAIKNVTIPYGVNTIDFAAFYECTNLESVSIPGSVSVIGKMAFSNCNNINNIVLPNHLTTIGEFAFYGCEHLLSVRVPESVCEIANKAFGFTTEDPTASMSKPIKIDGFMMYGYKSSAAARYAEKNDIAFQVIANEKLVGDVNSDSKVNIRDVTAMQRHLADMKMIDGNRLDLADTNCDGDISIDDATYIQSYLAEYLNTDVNVQFSQQGFTTTEAKQTLSGTYNNAVSVKSMQYVIENEEGVEMETGEVEFNADGTWQISDLMLVPEQNTVTVSASSLGGINSNDAVQITYNSGYEYDYNDSDVITEYEESCLDNILLVTFESDVSEARKTEIVQSVGGEVVGSINAIEMLQVKIPAKQTRAELEAVCSQLSAFEEVTDASTENFWDTEEESCNFNDPWDGNVSWDYLISMNQANWWCKAINLPKAWEYLPFCKRVNVGIADNGFDTSHYDLKLFFPTKEEKEKNKASHHGTHVAGIIGAKANNNYGIAGVNPTARLICSDSLKNGWQNINDYLPWHKKFEFNFYKSITALVESKAKVINFSIGVINPLNSSYIEETARKSSKMMGKLLKNHDFVVVQAAGNNHSPAETTGFFAAINKNNCYKDNASASYQEIKDRIIIVCNAERDAGEYKLHEDSNYGEHVDIAAPGTDIYSTTTSSGFKLDTGTSMAAPMVTGVASLVWAINPFITGAQVKDIVCTTADNNVEASIHDTNGTTYKLLDAKNAVETALAQRNDKKNLNLIFIDEEDGMPVLCEVIMHRHEDENTSVKYRHYYCCENLKTALPIGTYTIEIRPMYDCFYKQTYTFSINESDYYYSDKIVLYRREDSSPESDFTYTIADGEVTITGYKGSGGDIIIPSRFDGLPVKNIGDGVFQHNNTITSVTFKGNLNIIGSYAFSDCTGLKQVIIKGAVGTIGTYAFYNSKNLEKFYASEAVYSIQNAGFWNCTALSDFKVQDKIKYIGSYGFAYCTSLYDFEYPQTAEVNRFAFFGSSTKYKNDWAKL